MNLAWKFKQICPRHLGQSGLELQGNMVLNLGQFGLKIGQSDMEMWPYLIQPEDPAWKFRPIWPEYMGQSELKF